MKVLVGDVGVKSLNIACLDLEGVYSDGAAAVSIKMMDDGDKAER